MRMTMPYNMERFILLKAPQIKSAVFQAGNAELLFAGGLTLMGVYIILSTLKGVLAAYHPIPFWDQWETVKEFQAYSWGQYEISQLWAQHNEHRILIPRLFFFADYLLFAGTNVFLIPAILLVQGLHGWVLFSLLRRSRAISGAMKWAGLMFILICLFAAVQMETLAWGFEIQVVFVFFAATLAFTALIRCRCALGETGVSVSGWVWCGATLLAAMVATYSMGNGILVWPLVITLALWLKMPRRLVVILIAVGTLVVGSYLWGYSSPPHHTSPIESVRHWPEVVRYAAVYLGSPFGNYGLRASATIGFVGLVVSVWFGLRLLMWTATPNYGRAALTGVLFFMVGSALITGLGRLNFGLESALASRYTTAALIFWATAGALTVSYASTLDPAGRAFLMGITLTLFAFIGLALIDQQARTIQNFANLRQAKELAGLSLLVGVYDEAALGRIYPFTQDVITATPFLREHRLSIFSDGQHQLIGDPLSSHFAFSEAGGCLGYFDVVEPVVGSDHGAMVHGWSWDTDAERPSREVVLADSHDRIVGLASGGFNRADVPAAVDIVQTPYVGWQGYVLDNGQAITAYAVAHNRGSLCQLQGQHSVSRTPSSSP